ncbi:hypothetical protein CKO28_02770 [Rhodovibrio sodomensis]|uniref:Uncharacterized protein n=1 Tax=Rhodovibrio sodomensis TaxID=1088 RepID=A0ABS1DAN8_9PROT|nr:hypothetical protein [Rhodovibrio sodomensis]MBK1666966.1 hypothetical protein [Rhodovibrio sodomensis]
MFEFENLLSETAKQQLVNEESEIRVLFALPDHLLAVELLRMARVCRQRYPERLSNPHECVYEPSFVWQFIPELAKRLGATDLQPDEATRYADATDAELRFLAGVYLRNINDYNLGTRHEIETAEPDIGELLARDPGRGNPVAFAIDRICPPAQRDRSRDDYLVDRSQGDAETWYPEAS